jgi:uncharacterized protein YpiB (UPF0302 family)
VIFFFFAIESMKIEHKISYILLKLLIIRSNLVAYHSTSMFIRKKENAKSREKLFHDIIVNFARNIYFWLKGTLSVLD